MENVKNRLKSDLNKKDYDDKFVKLQSKLSFNGTHKSYEKYETDTIEHSEILMEETIMIRICCVGSIKIVCL